MFNNPSSGAGNGVRNLRAMFENNNNNANNDAPPSRGRSPADSDTSGTNRPLSKVRTSFIAVERSSSKGPQIGLRRAGDVSERSSDSGGAKDTSPLQEKAGMSHDTVEKPPSEHSTEHSDKASTPTPLEVRGENFSNRINNAFGSALNGGKIENQEPLRPTSDKMNGGGNFQENQQQPNRGSIGAILKGSAFDKTPPKEADISSPAASPEQISPSKPEPQKESPAPSETAEPGDDAKPAERPITPAAQTTEPQPAENTKSATEVAPAKATATEKALAKVAPAKGSPKKVASASSRKAPVSSKGPKTPTKPQSRQPSKATSPKAHTMSKDTKPSPKTTKAVQNASPATSTGSTQRKISATSPNNKVKPRSPTRPIRLPTNLTAPTAASAAKTASAASAPAAAPRAPSRTRGANTELRRKPSTNLHKSGAPVSSKTATHAPATSVRNKTSRQSLASQPPPVLHRSSMDRPRSRVSMTATTKLADEGFLARMMRPTASSASKVHDKTDAVSPPQKAKRMPSLKGLRPKHLLSSKKAANSNTGDKENEKQGEEKSKGKEPEKAAEPEPAAEPTTEPEIQAERPTSAELHIEETIPEEPATEQQEPTVEKTEETIAETTEEPSGETKVEPETAAPLDTTTSAEEQVTAQ
ncbi:MAG: hypothetical protein M1834_007884 [Cirrosporium novae-zelandiae]|nr:MAG: hypothetical protein M1834_007884 [Cirrosporium novae-zelandiae]